MSVHEVSGLIFWGQQGIQIYNDAYSKVMRGKHPSGLGQSVFATWPEREQELRPMLATVLGDKAIFEENQPWTLDREGVLTDYIFSIAMTPIADARGKIQGIFHTATETTDTVMLRRIQRGDELTAVFESSRKTIDRQ